MSKKRHQKDKNEEILLRGFDKLILKNFHSTMLIFTTCDICKKIFPKNKYSALKIDHGFLFIHSKKMDYYKKIFDKFYRKQE